MKTHITCVALVLFGSKPGFDSAVAAAKFLF